MLRSLDLDVGKGELFVLLGASGEGKTTILNMVAGVVRPERGRIYIDDVLVDDSGDIYTPPEERDIGYVFQNWALYPHMRVFDNIAFPLKMKKIPSDEIRRRVREVAEMLRIDHLLDRRPSQLSGGQQQRVAVARAIVKQPRVLLMDEPFSNLDPSLRGSVRLEIRGLIKRLGITTIMATHDHEEALMLGDRVAVLNMGRIAQAGSPQEIYEKPATLYVAAFVGKATVVEISDERARACVSELLGSGDSVPREAAYLALKAEDVIMGDTGAMAIIQSAWYQGDTWLLQLSLCGGVVVRARAGVLKHSRPGDIVRIRARRVYFYRGDGDLLGVLQ